MRRCYEVLYNNINNTSRFHAIVREIDEQADYMIRVDALVIFDNSISWRESNLTISKENIISIISEQAHPEYFL